MKYWLEQKTVISKAKHVAEKAITNLYCSIMPQCLGIAELGCSSGPNALFVILELVSTAYKACQKRGRQLPEIQVFLNDLPGNDFNTLFKTVTKFQQNLSQEMGNGVGPCYFMGVPGSFYGRLFPNRSLHFVHSSYSVHWLSQVTLYLYFYSYSNILTDKEGTMKFIWSAIVH